MIDCLCVQDWEAVVEYLMQKGDAEQALPVLRRPGVSQELWYKFAPALMLLSPGPTVDAWMTAQPPLDPPRHVLYLYLNVSQPYFISSRSSHSTALLLISNVRQ